MTTLELRTSIAAELDHMSVEMLENVSRYVRRLRRRSRGVSSQTEEVRIKRDAALQFVKTLSVKGNISVPAEERGVDALIAEKYDK